MTSHCGGGSLFNLEHEIHHKAQLAVYVRQMGLVAPFYALRCPLERAPTSLRGSNCRRAESVYGTSKLLLMETVPGDYAG